MFRLPSLRMATVAVVSLCLVTLLGLAAVQSQMTAPLVRDDGRQRAVDGAALSGDGAIHAVALNPDNRPQPQTATNPTQLRLQLAHSKVFDARALHGTVIKIERPENDSPGLVNPDAAAGMDGDAAPPADPDAQPVDPDSQPNPANELPSTVDPSQLNQATTSNAPAPAPITTFAGLDYATWGAGHPPDTNGDVGPTYYIQTINSSIGIYDKSNGNRVAAFTFNAFMSQGSFGNLCDTNNFGDPVVLYDTFEDRWFVTDFAFALDGSGNVSPQTVYQCFAVSKTGDPVNGGWNFYSIVSPGGLDDYPKFGVWPDGIYMSANMFGYTAGGSYIAPHVWALNKAQMYAGAPSASVVDFAAPNVDFTLLPANARLQSGTPPSGTPEYFVGTYRYLNAQTVYKFHVDWDTISNSTFTGPFTPLAPTCWPAQLPTSAATKANAADVLAIRAMAQAQYSNIGAAESLWVDHTVERGEALSPACGAATGGFASVRWYQIDVTGGTVVLTDVQGKTWDPDGANTSYRYVPSLAVDRMGNLAIGYSKSNSTTNPQIKYAGRLATDPLNTFSQAEQTLIDGTGSQLGNCGSTCTRWGDYSAMTLDPDGCTFWYTSEYYVTNGLNHQTRIGSFRFPGCTVTSSTTTLVVDPATGTHGGTVNLSATLTSNSNPVSGKSVSFSLNGTSVGSASTNGSGVASLSNVSLTGIAVGTYPTGVSASWAGDSSYDPSSATASLEVDEGAASTTTSLTSSSNPSVFSQSVSFTATVTSGAGTPTTGSVQFKINGVNFGSPVALDGTGKAVSGTTTTLAVGNRPISAVYSGTSGFGPSTGNLTQTVNKAAATVAVTSNHNPAKKGTKIIFTVTVTPTAPATATPTGKVKLFRNGVGLGTKHNLVSGQAAITVTWTAAKGTFNITAKYFGSANFLVAVSPAYQQVIN